MTDEQLAAIEARWASLSVWTSDMRHHDAHDVALLLREVRRLRATLLDLHGAFTDAGHPLNRPPRSWGRAPEAWLERVRAALAGESM